jgi:hypothetical protein
MLAMDIYKMVAKDLDVQIPMDFAGAKKTIVKRKKVTIALGAEDDEVAPETDIVQTDVGAIKYCMNMQPVIITDWLKTKTIPELDDMLLIHKDARKNCPQRLEAWAGFMAEIGRLKKIRQSADVAIDRVTGLWLDAYQREFSKGDHLDHKGFEKAIEVAKGIVMTRSQFAVAPVAPTQAAPARVHNTGDVDAMDL